MTPLGFLEFVVIDVGLIWKGWLLGNESVFHVLVCNVPGFVPIITTADILLSISSMSVSIISDEI